MLHLIFPFQFKYFRRIPYTIYLVLAFLPVIRDPVPVASDTPCPIEVAVLASPVISAVPVSKKALSTELVSMVAVPPCRTVPSVPVANVDVAAISMKDVLSVPTVTPGVPVLSTSGEIPAPAVPVAPVAEVVVAPS